MSKCDAKLSRSLIFGSVRWPISFALSHNASNLSLHIAPNKIFPVLTPLSYDLPFITLVTVELLWIHDSK